ncbi:MAG: hypothetical protein ABFD69_03100 [Candidatus Sumerlaeia bacterium]
MKHLLALAALCCLVVNLAGCSRFHPGQDRLVYKTRMTAMLADEVPNILKTYDPKTGHLGTGYFVMNDQMPIYALAVAYATPGTKCHKDPQLLEAIMRVGDVFVDNQDANGKWRFDKKDGSYWGQAYLAWPLARWVRAYGLVQNDMPPDRRERWERSLAKAYAGVAKGGFGSYHMSSASHALGLYLAGDALGRPEWKAQAADYMRRLAEAQSEAGYWSEHSGPVVHYGFVFIDALGTYYALSRDEAVLPALRNAAVFQSNFTYPDGTNIETVDERPLDRDTVDPGNVGLTFTPEGRAFLDRQWETRKWKIDPDIMASLVLYGEEGEMARPAAHHGFVLHDKGEPRALTMRKGPWFVAMSGYTAPLSDSRWVQDRQSFVSIWNESAGLIAGGGNTKLQPAWSSFTVGDCSLLKHAPGDEKPDFKPRSGLYHVPAEAKLVGWKEPRLELVYGPVACRIDIQARRSHVDYIVSASGQTDLPVQAHLTLLPRMGAPIATAGGFSGVTGKDPVDLDAAAVGGWIQYNGMKMVLPEGTELHWPALPHNPFVKNGHAGPEEGRIELRIPLKPNGESKTVRIERAPGI